MRADSGRTDRFFHFPRASRRLILGAAIGLAAVVPVAAEELSLADCERERRRAPAELDSYACYWRLARRNEIHPARAALAGVLAREPENWAAWLYRARIEGDQGEDAAEPHYRLAIAGFSRVGQPRGEGRARLGLALLLGRRGRFDEADVEVAAAEVAARASGERTLELAVACERGWQALRRGQYGESAERFDSVWPEVSRSGDRALQAYCLSGRGGVAMELGRFAAAVELTQRQAELCHELGDAYDEARARGNLVLAGFRLAHAGELSPEQVRRWAEEALAAARRGGNRGSEARAELYLGDLTEGAEARAHYRAGLEMSRETREAAGLVLAHRGLALNAIESGAADAHAAYAEVERARELARGSRFYSAVAELARARMRWHTGPRQHAIRDSLAALEAIEAIRDLQADDLVRARVFGIWAFAYHRFAGELLAAPGRSDADLELAFEITERMRARVLLDELDAARVSVALAPRGDLAVRRDALLDEMARAERVLLPPDLPAAEREVGAARLTALKQEEARLRAELFAATPEYRALRSPHLAALAEVRRLLAPDQILIAFQVASRFNVDNRITEHGSWIWLVAHDSVAVEPVPDQAELRSAVDLFQGLIARRDGAEREAAAALCGRLFGDLLARVPTARRLVLIPDGPLHRLPFGALRASPGAPTLAERYELSIVSSATVWSRLRGGAGSDAGVRPYFLAVSDPQVGAGPDVTSEPAASRSNATSSLRPLPRARREATALARAFHSAGEIWLGEQATEARLKRADLAPFGVLHFAAHAQVDDRRPERSAIVLAPDAGGDDGLLTAAEIVRLRVENRIVVLAACRSGGGATLEGEGVLSLARAFFQAGARSVVAALVPLRDDESAELLAEFFDRLARGETAAASLAGADRSQIRSGRPVAAWSTVVALGDGEARLARPIPSAPARALWPALLAALALAAGYYVSRRRGKGSRRRPDALS